MKLHLLPKTTKTKQKRLGRGIGSGRGKTSARGTKGQKARGKIPQGFTGENLPLYKKLPYRRGLGNRKVSVKQLVIDVTRLERIKAKTIVEVSTLIDHKMVDARQATVKGVKIVGKGPLTVALTVKLPTSKAAAAAITKAGGSVE